MFRFKRTRPCAGEAPMAGVLDLRLQLIGTETQRKVTAREPFNHVLVGEMTGVDSGCGRRLARVET